MKWPFVSRLAFEISIERCASLCRDKALLREELKREQARSASTLDAVLHLKVSGAQTMRPVADKTDAPRARPPRSDIQQAIDENKYASKNPALRTWCATWAQREIDKHPDSEQHRQYVLNRLRTWSLVSAEDDDDDDDVELIALESNSDEPLASDADENE